LIRQALTAVCWHATGTPVFAEEDSGAAIAMDGGGKDEAVE
jgi:hypothetical protein